MLLNVTRKNFVIFIYYIIIINLEQGSVEYLFILYYLDYLTVTIEKDMHIEDVETTTD